MSTKKNGIKITSNRTSVPTSTRKRVEDQSTDRSKTKKDTKTLATKPRVTSKIVTKKKEDEEPPKRIISNRDPPKRTPTQKPSMTQNKTKVETKKSSRPITPTSTRVTKTKYFPTKNIYSYALKNEKNKKFVNSPQGSTDNSVSTSCSERPRTATLRRGSVVNSNIAGPEVPLKSKIEIQPSITSNEVKEEEDDDDDTYADDFDSYESDFEQYNSSDSSTTLGSEISTGSTSSSDRLEEQSNQNQAISVSNDDEKKLDSGNFDLPETKQKRHFLDGIKESVEKEININHNRSNMASLSDEGFEEAKSLQFINFLGAQKKYEMRKDLENRRKRGEEILSMIRLDTYTYTLLDIKPIPYEEFIKTFGQRNCLQASVQTGDDNLNEETQTDNIIFHNKWTQFPPVFTKIEDEDNFWAIHQANYLGVGSDTLEKVPEISNSYNKYNLDQFLLRAGNLILNLLTERDKNTIGNLNKKSSLPFSEGFMLYETHRNEKLKDKKLVDVLFWSEPGKFLTIHRQDENLRSFVYFWRVGNLESPETVFMVSGGLNCCAFSEIVPFILFGGLDNGTIALWDTRENISYHNGVNESEDLPTRTPTYTTEINYGHKNKIVAIQSLSSSTSNKKFFEAKTSTEICSLDEEGDVIIWTVIAKSRDLTNIVNNIGLAHWGSVILTINIRISLKNSNLDVDDFKCTDLVTNPLDPTHLFISTNHGQIIQCLSNGTKANIKKIHSDHNFRINCLETCPFSFDYYLAGFNDGSVRLYSRSLDRYLIKLSDKDCFAGKSSIEMIQWSQNRPFIFYTKDVCNTIHIWDLIQCDMVPTYSIPFKDKIIAMKLSKAVNENNKNDDNYMIIATENGNIYLHILNEEHGSNSVKKFESDKKRFFNYIDRMI